MEPFGGPADVARIEATPLAERLGIATVHDMIVGAAARDPSAPALVWLPDGTAACRPETITYAELLAQVTATANLFHSLGVRDRASVSLLLPNLPETVFALWGGSAAGVANPFNPLLSPAQIAEIMAAAGSRVLVTGGPDKAYDVHAKALAVRSLYPALETLVVVGEPAGEGVAYGEAVAGQPTDRLISGRTIRPDDVSTYFHTGGTTGAPKLAQQTHGNQVFMAWTCAFLAGLTPADRVLTGLPLFHANAAVATGLSAIWAGASTLLCGQQGYRNKATVADFWRIADAHGATVFSGVPTIYAALLESLGERPPDHRLRLGLCGAAPMPVSLFRQFEGRTSVDILEIYGMTETAAVSTSNPRDGERRIGSIGLRLPYQGVRPAVLDETGAFVRDCAQDEVGHLLLGGPGLFPGYRQARFNDGAWPLPGWFNSGDLARVDADGYVWLAGRAKDLIIRSGHNIDPAVIEEALHRHPAVELAAAVGRPCAYAGEVPIAYVSLKAGAQADAEDLRRFAADQVPERPAAPAEVIILNAIPATAVGKIFKPPLRQDAVRRAYAKALADGDVAGEVATRVDDRRGIVAVVTTDASDAAVAACLGGFTVPFEVAAP